MRSQETIRFYQRMPLARINKSIVTLQANLLLSIYSLLYFAESVAKYIFAPMPTFLAVSFFSRLVFLRQFLNRVLIFCRSLLRVTYSLPASLSTTDASCPSYEVVWLAEAIRLPAAYEVFVVAFCALEIFIEVNVNFIIAADIIYFLDS